MTRTPFLFRELSDVDLLARVRDAAQAERHATATLIALLMEVDARRVYLGEGYSSLFTFCTQALHLSEHAAYGRIQAARAARRFPGILERLDAGELTLTSVCLLAPHLTQENATAVLGEAAHKTKRDVEQIVARLAPRSDVTSGIRRMPGAPSLTTTTATAPLLATSENTPTASVASPSPPLLPLRTSSKASNTALRSAMMPLAPERFKLQLTVSRETHDKLRRVQELLRHAIPNADVEAIFDRALTLLLEKAERTKFASTRHPRADPKRGCHPTRYIPAAIKRAVWQRDEGRCAFVGTIGRCTETAFLEFHHVTPFAQGGRATENNLELRCRAHNAYEEERRNANPELGPRPS